MTDKLSSFGGILLAQKVNEAYSEGQTDYSLEPFVRVDQAGQPLGRIKQGDSVVFCCRRGEREIELTEAFTDPDFSHFSRNRIPDLDFVILTLYHEKFKDLPVAFAPSKVENTLGEVISKAGLTQFRCAESEKFAHVTFFLNGGHNQPFPGENDVRIPSPRGIPFDQVPELSLPQVTREVIRGLSLRFPFVVTNFANGDVIGHTSNREAKIKCAEIIDSHLGQVVEEARKNDYVILITADHGNIEELLTPEGKPHVAHTTNLVPFLVIDGQKERAIRANSGSLEDIAPTILNILNIPKPAIMTGKNLITDFDFGKKRNVLLIILDGWGEGQPDDNNPVFLASTPVWDRLKKTNLSSFLRASGEAVGLQAGKPGNSEAGHMNIGAGRIVLQDDVRLDRAMQDGSFYANSVFQDAIQHCKNNQSALHLIGLLTEKSSHGSIDYPLAVLKIAKKNGLNQVFLHLILDGRSTEPGSAPVLLHKLETRMAEIGIGEIVTAVGRGIALDRDGNYSKIKKAYDALVSGIGEQYTG